MTNQALYDHYKQVASEAENEGLCSTAKTYRALAQRLQIAHNLYEPPRLQTYGDLRELQGRRLG